MDDRKKEVLVVYETGDRNTRVSLYGSKDELITALAVAANSVATAFGLPLAVLLAAISMTTPLNPREVIMMQVKSKEGQP